MRIERDQCGDFLLEPAALAEKLSIPPEDLRRRMRLGLVTSLVEAGEGADAGQRRLTVRCGAAVWRAVVDANDLILAEEVGLDQTRRPSLSDRAAILVTRPTPIIHASPGPTPARSVDAAVENDRQRPD